MKKELTNISEKSLMKLENIVDEEMLTVEDVNEMLAHTDKGRTRQTIRNCVTVLQNDPVLKKAIRRNEFSGRIDIVKEVPWERRNNSLTETDTDDYNLKMYLEENYEITSERVINCLLYTSLMLAPSSIFWSLFSSRLRSPTRLLR